MNQKTKLGEAKYFLSSIKEECEVTEHFRYNLSAFLTAARSVLQYTLKDVDPRNNRLAKHGAKDWYYKFTSCNAVLNFFKDKRDINIHLEPIQVRKDVDITIMESIHLSESVIVKIMPADGSEEIRPIPTESKEEPKTPDYPFKN